MDPTILGGLQSWLTGLLTDGAVAGGTYITSNLPDMQTTKDDPTSGVPTWLEVVAILAFLFLIVALIHELKGL